ncbi:MAG: S4 domain-containing protein [Gammaproteobacteria bacterium]|nr:S4 domain-containing protein [Gammaproteobacteria bacterium]
MQSQTCDKVRLDKWLWAARFFKTRALATEAINGGHVHLNGSRVKPSRPLLIGDRLTIRKGADSYEVTVLQLADKRGSATLARELYAEEEAARLKREQLAEQRRLEMAMQPHPPRRPDKKGRRQIIRFINKNG